MKTIGKLLILVVLLSFIVGCAPKAATTETQTTQPEVSQPVVTEPPLTAAEQWAKDNGVGPYQPETLDWDAIEAAAIEEGSVCVYANSSKFEKLLDAWSELYPQISLDCGDTDDIATKMAAEQEAGNVVGDVWYNSDGHILYGEFVPNEWAWSFVPDGYENPEVTAEQPFSIARHSIDVWGYNIEAHPDGCPISNWWQLTEPQYKGKVYMEDPMADVSTMAKMATVIQYGDEMAAAYKDLYGVEWTTDPLYGDDTPNAGWLWLKKMAQNQPGIEPGGDEVDAAYATIGMDVTTEPGFGLTGWDSVVATQDGEIAMGACLNLEPAAGLMKTTYLAIANNAPHPNAAKLFIKFTLTNEDGYKPWYKMGVYPGNDLVTPPEGMPPMSDIALFYMDPVFDWNNVSAVRDFWAINLLGQ
jgi:iron(III) transport system substrate-binding protein